MLEDPSSLPRFLYRFLLLLLLNPSKPASVRCLFPLVVSLLASLLSLLQLSSSTTSCSQQSPGAFWSDSSVERLWIPVAAEYSSASFGFAVTDESLWLVTELSVIACGSASSCFAVTSESLWLVTETSFIGCSSASFSFAATGESLCLVTELSVIACGSASSGFAVTGESL